MTGPRMKATDFKSVKKNTLRGFFTLSLPSGLILNECSYHRDGDGREWIGLPGKPQIDQDGKQRTDPSNGKKLYVNIIDFDGKETRSRFQSAALAAVHALLKETA